MTLVKIECMPDIQVLFFYKKIIQITSCGGTSNETVLRSTFRYVSMHGIMKKIPGPFAPPFRRRPRRKITDRSYS